MTREKQIEYFKGCLMATGREGIDDFNHLMDAMRYALEKYIKKGSGWLYK